MRGEVMRMKNILCFGDSNTFGVDPSGGRHPWHVRWPGRLQFMLGGEYHVIEEGQGGRTTVWDDPLEPILSPGRNGAKALPIALASHRPLDMVILMLGTNDCKLTYNVTPAVIAKGIETLCRMIVSFDYRGAAVPKILIISPVYILDGVENGPFISFDEKAPALSRQLASHFAKVARDNGCLFMDAAKCAHASLIDCLHMDAASHIALARGVAEVVRDYFMMPDSEEVRAHWYNQLGRC